MGRSSGSEGSRELFELILGKMDAPGAEVLLEMVERGGAGDEHDVRRTVQEPGEGQR